MTTPREAKRLSEHVSMRRLAKNTVTAERHEMLEKQIERRVCEHAHARGMTAYKFTSPARAAVPDRIFLAPVPEFLRPLMAQYIRFVEMKRTGAKPTVAQEREHARLRALGFTVDVVDSVEQGKTVVEAMG